MVHSEDMVRKPDFLAIRSYRQTHRIDADINAADFAGTHWNSAGCDDGPLFLFGESLQKGVVGDQVAVVFILPDGFLQQAQALLEAAGDDMHQRQAKTDQKTKDQKPTKTETPTSL